MAAKGRPRGPVPKRSDQRRRRNIDSDAPDTVLASAGPRTEMIPANPEWHDVARQWYESLAESGQSEFYEASDWATAHYVAEAMSRNLLQGRFSAQLFAAVMSGMTELLTTEGARRRARIELERAKDDGDSETSAKVAQMNEYRKAAGK